LKAGIPARVAEASKALKQAGIPDAEADIDARLLAQFALGRDAAEFLTRLNDPVPPDFPAAYERLIERRINREPLAYIAGEKEFWNLSFEVSPAVLIPRPETELIVEAALARSGAGAPLAAADVCTGSGCLAIALAHERQRATVLATDISAEALAVARRNALRHHVTDRVRFVQCDLLADAPGPFDLIVSNPPYIPEREFPTLQPEVLDYEPAVALVSGGDGLEAIRGLVVQSGVHLKPGGYLIFEFGFGQSDAVREILSGLAFCDVELIRDLQGIPRTAIAKRRS